MAMKPAYYKQTSTTPPERSTVDQLKNWRYHVATIALAHDR